MMAALPFSKFAIGWMPALAVTAAVDPAPRLADLFAFELVGFTVAPVPCLLAAIGVLAARPLARKSESELGWGGFALVTLLMLILVEIWVLEQRPSVLFAFVLAMGLGFAGYSLIEALGVQLKEAVGGLVQSVAGKLGVAKKEDQP